MDRRIALRTIAGASAALTTGALSRTSAAQTTAPSPAAASPPPVPVAGNAPPLDGSEYQTKTLMAGTLSKQTSLIAEQKAHHPRVKQFAGFEAAEQTAVAQVLTDTADPPPAKLDPEHESQIQALQQLAAGPEFDRAYVAGQIRGHQELLTIQQGYLGNSSRVPDTQHIAVLARAVIMMHLTMLQDIQNTLHAA